MADYGLLSALAGGVQQGIESFDRASEKRKAQEQRDWERDRDRQELDRKRDRDQALLQNALSKGKEKDKWFKLNLLNSLGKPAAASKEGSPIVDDLLREVKEPVSPPQANDPLGEPGLPTNENVLDYGDRAGLIPPPQKGLLGRRPQAEGLLPFRQEEDDTKSTQGLITPPEKPGAVPPGYEKRGALTVPFGTPGTHEDHMENWRSKAWSSKLDMARQRMEKDLDASSKARGGFGDLQKRIFLGQRLATLARTPDGKTINLPKVQTQEFAEAFMNFLNNGSSSGSEHRVMSLVPDSARGSAKDFLSWLSNDPKGRDQQAFITNMLGTLDRENQVMQGQYGELLSQKLAPHQMIKQYDPKFYKKQLGTFGIDPKTETYKTKLLPGDQGLNESDPRVKKARDVGYTDAQIMNYLNINGRKQ